MQTAKKRAGPIDQHVARRIRQIRCDKKVLHPGQYTLAEMSRYLGVSYQQVQKYENGKSSITSGMLLKIAKYLSVPITTFYDEMPPEGELAEWSQFDVYGYEDMLQRTEYLRLVDVFSQIHNPKLRIKIFNLMQEILECELVHVGEKG